MAIYLNSMPQFPKDPHEKLDYFFDWSAWLLTDTISSATVTASAGLTLESFTQTATSVTAWVSGGISGQPYEVTCKITTTSGRVAERSFILQVNNR